MSDPDPWGQRPSAPAPGDQSPSPGQWAPPPGGPYAPQQGYTPARATNGLAIASMVLGILWIYWVGSILALIFGYIAKRQIAERNEAGAGMATAGIVLGWVGVGVLVLGVVLGLILAMTGALSDVSFE